MRAKLKNRPNFPKIVENDGFWAIFSNKKVVYVHLSVFWILLNGFKVKMDNFGEVLKPVIEIFLAVDGRIMQILQIRRR